MAQVSFLKASALPYIEGLIADERKARQATKGHVILTAAEYAALATKDSGTVYIVTA